MFNGRNVNSDSLRFTENNTVIDFEAILTLPNGLLVGIISTGDDYQLRAKLEDHIAKGVHTIVCCTRSRNVNGSTFRMIQDEFQPNHPIVLEQLVNRSTNRNLRDAKAGVVNSVLAYIQTLL